MTRSPFLKRFGDLLLAATAIVLLAPVLAAVWLAVRIAMGRPVFFVDMRAGQDARPIRIVKFRSMREAVDATGRSLPDAERLGAFGRFLRRSSLDELPQFWSILCGDMSFVGPRPALFNQDDLVALRTRTGVDQLAPGLTGWAQVNGRDLISVDEKARLDAEYLRCCSMGFDLYIIGLTLRNVLARKDVSH